MNVGTEVETGTRTGILAWRGGRLGAGMKERAGVSLGAEETVPGLGTETADTTAFSVGLSVAWLGSGGRVRPIALLQTVASVVAFV